MKISPPQAPSEECDRPIMDTPAELLTYHTERTKSQRAARGGGEGAQPVSVTIPSVRADARTEREPWTSLSVWRRAS